MNTTNIQRNEVHTDIHGFPAAQSFMDIHSHLLPRVDDGAQSLEQSIRMARVAAMEGIGRIILTPHQRTDRPSVSPEGTVRRMWQLQQEINRRKIPLRLYAGAEIFYRHGVEELLSEGRLLTLAGSRYCLMEFFPRENYGYIRDGLNRLSAFGYLPILAHAERYEQLMESGRAEELKRSTGCLYQLNAASITGENGFLYKSRSRKLLKNGLADFIATDAHDEKGRGPRITRLANWLEKRYGKEERDRLLLHNPVAVSEDREIWRINT